MSLLSPIKNEQEKKIDGASFRLLNGKPQYQARVGAMLKWSAWYRPKADESDFKTVWAENEETARLEATHYIGTHEHITIDPDYEFGWIAAGWTPSQYLKAVVFMGEELAVQRIAANNSELFRSAPIRSAAE